MWRFGRPATLLLVLVVLVSYLVKRGSSDFSGLPIDLVPHRPWPIVAINGAGSIYRELMGFSMLPTLDGAINAACTAAKLPPGAACQVDIPGEPEWRVGLEKLLESYAADAALTTIGRLIAAGHLQQWLVTRMRLIHAWSIIQPPGALAAEAISAPIFIVGLPRTGTTFLHNLMMQDPSLRAPLHWELTEPIPAHGKPADTAHVASIQDKLDQFTQLAPGMAEWHPMESTMAEECVVTFRCRTKAELTRRAPRIPSSLPISALFGSIRSRLVLFGSTRLRTHERDPSPRP